MTAPAPSGPSALRIGGLALIGVGVIAGVIGLSTAATSGSPPAAAASTTVTATPEPAPPATPPATTETPAPTPPAPAPTSEAPVPVPSFGPTPTGAIAAPPSPAPPAPAAGDGAVTKAPVRVYNNSTIVGLAARAAEDFRSSGWPIEKVSNYPSGIIPTSTVYYRPGTDEQAAAAALGGQFGLRVEPRFAGLTEASPGLIVIVTNDYQRR